jgi:pyridoxamine 5'-phosphate oxidase-like protein
MGKVLECITPDLKAFIEAQPLFFVATAPLSGHGHVNLSPKGLDSLRVLSSSRIAYLDLTGSGNETAAHLQENGRITLMFCAFTGAPRVLRLHGTGEVVLPGSPEWAELIGEFPAYPGVRQIIAARISRVATSCGYAVPLMDYAGQRDTLLRWAEAKGETLPLYRQEKNATSIDGLPAPLAPEATSPLA